MDIDRMLGNRLNSLVFPSSNRWQDRVPLALSIVLGLTLLLVGGTAPAAGAGGRQQ